MEGVNFATVGGLEVSELHLPWVFLAGINLDQAIHSPDTVVHSEAPTEVDCKSEADTDTEVEADSEAPLMNPVCH